MPPASTRAVRFDRYGGPDVLYVADVPTPRPGPGEVLVEVRAAAINPGEAAIRSGAMDPQSTGSFPSGEGSDLAGVVVAAGPDVTAFGLGDEVLGYSWTRSSHATHAAVPATQLIRKPSGMAWEVAGSLYVVGVTAYAAARAVGAGPGDVVAVSAAAGGVGRVLTQLLVHRGARVLGIASNANAGWLTAHGAVPVEYGAAGPGGGSEHSWPIGSGPWLRTGSTPSSTCTAPSTSIWPSTSAWLATGSRRSFLIRRLVNWAPRPRGAPTPRPPRSCRRWPAWSPPG